MSETAAQAYARGIEAGKIAIRLDHHDEAIAATNRVLDRTVEISQTNASIVQTLSEARVTDAATRIALADAVSEARDASEAQASKAWSPAARLIAALGAGVGVLGILWAILSSLPNL